MLDMAAAFAFCKLPRGNRVAVITGSGGSAVWMSDILSAHGLELPVLEEDLQQRLMALLPSYASAQNPVDGTAQAIHEVGYAKLVELVRAVAADRHDPADRLARQRSNREEARRGIGRQSPAIPSSRSCCRPIRPRPRARWPLSPKPASPATPRCRAAPGRSARWSTTPSSRRAAASRKATGGNPVGIARGGRPRPRRRRSGADRGRGQGAACALWCAAAARGAGHQRAKRLQRRRPGSAAPSRSRCNRPTSLTRPRPARLRSASSGEVGSARGLSTGGGGRQGGASRGGYRWRPGAGDGAAGP